MREIPVEMFHVPKRAVPAAKAATASALWTDSQAARQVPADSFRSGDQVKHNVFGLGIVEKIEALGSDAQITVAFEEVGRKKLMLSFAGLEKVDVW